jgi:hypothetical protein
VIRLVLAAVFVGIVGVFTGTINLSAMVDRIPHPGRQDDKRSYLQLVEGDFARLRPQLSAFVNGGCSPDPALARSCRDLSGGILADLRSFQSDLNGVSVPDSLRLAHSNLEAAVSTAIRGFNYVGSATYTRRRGEWNRAGETLVEADALFGQAYRALPVDDRPALWSWGY